MDWGRIKTIFIIAFLSLNIYLGYEFYKLYNSSQFDYLSETSIENQLSAEEITYVDPPKNITKGKYLSAIPKKFTGEDITKAMDTRLDEQEISILNDTMIEAVLEKPFKLSKNFSPNELNSFLKSRVLYGEEYRFWERDLFNNTITYYQQIDNKLLYKNINGELTFYLNEDNEIVSYRQTLLEGVEEFSEEENILQPIKAIEILYESGKLPYASKITSIEPGYYTLVQLSSSQVLTPVWRFVVNDERNLFVNAVEGQIIELENEGKKIVE